MHSHVLEDLISIIKMVYKWLSLDSGYVSFVKES